MERLTERVGNYIHIKGNKSLYDGQERHRAYLQNAIIRLAAYEDTGLTPEEIMEMIPTENEPLTLDELREMDGYPIFLKRPGYCDRWGLVQVREGLTDNVYFTFNNGTSVLARLELKYGKAYRRKLEIL